MRHIFPGIILLTALWPVGSAFAENSTALNCPTLALPLRAYDLRCGQKVHGEVLVNRCPLSLPKVSGILSPGMFWQ